MGKRRPTPKALVEILMPGAACWRLYSLRSIRRTTKLDHLWVKASERGDLLGGFQVVDILFEDAVENVIGRKRIAILLVGPQLGGGRLGDGCLGNDGRARELT